MSIYCNRCLGAFPEQMFVHGPTGALIQPAIHNLQPPHFASGVAIEPDVVQGMMLHIPTNLLQSINVHDDHVEIRTGHPGSPPTHPDVSAAHASRALSLYQKALQMSPDALERLEQVAADNSSGA